MSKGSWRRPFDQRAFDANHERIFGRKTSDSPIVKESVRAGAIDRLARAITGERHLVLSLDELRTIVFKTSVAYARPGASIQEAEWNRAAALRDALEDLGYTREAEMIGGAG